MRRCHRRPHGYKLFDAALIPCTQIFNMGELIQTYWAEILLGLMAFIKIVVNITPTKADNKVFGWFDILINAIVSDRRKKRKDAREDEKKA